MIVSFSLRFMLHRVLFSLDSQNLSLLDLIESSLEYRYL